MELPAGANRQPGNHYGAINPLGRVPALERPEGPALFDSRVICEYFASLSSKLPRLTDEAAWRDLRLQSLGDGICDAAVPHRWELARPQEQRSSEQMAFWALSVSQALDMLEQNRDEMCDPATPTIGNVAVACALGYLDFRFAHTPWRGKHPRLAGWFEQISGRASLRTTLPEG